jgi:hypothetical protein
MRLAFLTSLVALGIAPPALGAGHDYPALGHIQGYHIGNYVERSFDTFTFGPEEGQKIPVSGHVIWINYYADDSSIHASDMEIYLNYISALKNLKAEILRTPANMNDNDEHIVARFYRNESPIYVNIHAGSSGNDYEIVLVEQKEFKPSIVTTPDK